MSDLVERLRLGDGTSPDHALLMEAAARIEQLEKYVVYGTAATMLKMIEDLKDQLADAQASPISQEVIDRLREDNKRLFVMHEKLVMASFMALDSQSPEDHYHLKTTLSDVCGYCLRCECKPCECED